MKKQLNSQRWLRSFVLIVLALVLLLSALMYVVDPFFRFRVKDNSYMLNPRYVNAGLIRNYDYDTLIIGSSMTQNFNMELFRQELGAKPLHVSMGGITPLETAELLSFADEIGRAERYYVGIDLHCFNTEPTLSNNPSYLFDGSPLSTARYLMSYEAWFRFLPVDLAFLALNAADVSLPPKFARSCDIDMLANWADDFSYGEDVVLSNYLSDDYAVSEVDTVGLAERLQNNFELVFDSIAGFEEDVVFFFPPYSMLYWHNSAEYMDIFLDAKAYFIARAEELGCTVYDFQPLPQCMDLSYYRDSSHYSAELNDYMTLSFASGEHQLRSTDVPEARRMLMENLEAFRKNYSDVLK